MNCVNGETGAQEAVVCPRSQASQRQLKSLTSRAQQRSCNLWAKETWSCLAFPKTDWASSLFSCLCLPPCCRKCLDYRCVLPLPAFMLAQGSDSGHQDLPGQCFYLLSHLSDFHALTQKVSRKLERVDARKGNGDIST